MLTESIRWTPRRLPSGEISGHHQARAGASIGCSRPALSTHTSVRGLYDDPVFPIAYASEPFAPAAIVGIQPFEILIPSTIDACGPASRSRFSSNGATQSEPVR